MIHRKLNPKAFGFQFNQKKKKKKKKKNGAKIVVLASKQCEKHNSLI